MYYDHMIIFYVHTQQKVCRMKGACYYLHCTLRLSCIR